MQLFGPSHYENTLARQQLVLLSQRARGRRVKNPSSGQPQLIRAKTNGGVPAEALARIGMTDGPS